MLDTAKQMRFAQSCSDAAFGYVLATTAAYGAMTTQTLDFWKGQLLPTPPEPEPRSWYRHPDAPKRAAPAAFTGAPWMPLLPWQTAMAMPANPFAAMLDACAMAPQAWADMVTMKRSPTAWPMAYAMMAMGLPRAVAMPAAEANAAVLDAAQQASEAINTSYSTYRSDSGHATAHVIFAGPPTGSMLGLVAMATPLAWPWLSGLTAGAS